MILKFLRFEIFIFIPKDIPAAIDYIYEYRKRELSIEYPKNVALKIVLNN